VLFLRLLL